MSFAERTRDHGRIAAHALKEVYGEIRANGARIGNTELVVELDGTIVISLQRLDEHGQPSGPPLRALEILCRACPPHQGCAPFVVLDLVRGIPHEIEEHDITVVTEAAAAVLATVLHLPQKGIPRP